MSTTDEPYDLTVSEAAEILGIHINTLTRWSDEGIVPCWRTALGRYRRYRRSDIEALRDDGSAA